MTKTEELERYKEALQDIAAYSPYTGTRERAESALDLSKEFVKSPPRRGS